MKIARLIIFICIIALGIGLISLFIIAKVTTPFKSTLAPFFKIIGKTTKSVDRIFSKMIPADDIDEAELGNYFVSYYSLSDDPLDPKQTYIDSLFSGIAPFAQKNFTYRVFKIDYTDPNAFALPGGVILVTSGLLDIMKTDGEVVSILAHEMGHIERSHCFDAVKFEILGKKIGSDTLGRLLELITNLLLSHSFSKTEEDEADEYAFELLTRSRFDPGAQGRAFRQLKTFIDSYSYSNSGDEKANLFRDYFMSHPPLEIRIEKAEENAKVWHLSNKNEKRDP